MTVEETVAKLANGMREENSHLHEFDDIELYSACREGLSALKPGMLLPGGSRVTSDDFWYAVKELIEDIGDGDLADELMAGGNHDSSLERVRAMLAATGENDEPD